MNIKEKKIEAAVDGNQFFDNRREEVWPPVGTEQTYADLHAESIIKGGPSVITDNKLFSKLNREYAETIMSGSSGSIDAVSMNEKTFERLATFDDKKITVIKIMSLIVMVSEFCKDDEFMFLTILNRK